MNHYKSWSALRAQLTERLCPALRGRITYFLTYYHDVHNAYGRAAIRLDGRELVCFSWPAIYRQDADLHRLWQEAGRWDWEDPALRAAWDREGVYCERDFLRAATAFLDLPIADALESADYIVRILAVLDRRVGRRRLRALQDAAEDLPGWVRQFYVLRLGAG